MIVLQARATTHTLTLTTLRGLKIYLLFNRLVRRFVMSVNVVACRGLMFMVVFVHV